MNRTVSRSLGFAAVVGCFVCLSFFIHLASKGGGGGSFRIVQYGAMLD